MSIFTFVGRQAGLGLFGLLLPVAALAQAPTITSFSPATAAPGSTVTVTGTNLTGFTAVLLNGQEVVATAGSPRASKLSFVVPPASGSGRIRISTALGSVVSGPKLGVTRTSSNRNYTQLSANSTGATATGNFSTPVACDLDKDGLLELLVGQGDGTMVLYEQTAPNSAFGTAGTAITSGGTAADVGLYAKPTVSDLDGDGLQEIIVGEETGNVLIYEQLASTGATAYAFGTGTVLFANPYGATPSGTPNFGSYARPTVGDLNGNGLIEIVVGGNDGTLHRYEQKTATANTTAGFNALGYVKLGDGSTIDAGDVSKPLITDYDGDGKLDMLVGTQAGAIKMYTQTSPNSVMFNYMQDLSADGTAATAINMGNAGTNASNKFGYAAPAVTDYDGDGLLDLFVGNGTGVVYRYEQATSTTAPSLTAPLPVVLVAFEATATATGNRLSWATAQELNSARFVVEASADGSNYAALATLAAAGTSTALIRYEFVDAAPAAGLRYYRLRQEDQDGTSSYSPVVSVSRAAGNLAGAKVAAYPNPFAGELAVALPGAAQAQATTVTLLSLSGRPVYAAELELSAAPQALRGLPELPAGVYILRLTTANGSSCQKVVRR